MDPRTRALLEAPIAATLLRLAAPNVLVMVVQAVIIHFIWGKDLKASHDAETRVMAMNAADSILDWRLLKQSLVILAVVMIAFVLARPLHLVR